MAAAVAALLHICSHRATAPMRGVDPGRRHGASSARGQANLCKSISSATITPVLMTPVRDATEGAGQGVAEPGRAKASPRSHQRRHCQRRDAACGGRRRERPPERSTTQGRGGRGGSGLDGRCRRSRPLAAYRPIATARLGRGARRDGSAEPGTTLSPSPYRRSGPPRPPLIAARLRVTQCDAV